MSDLIVKANKPKLTEDELNFFALTLGECIADFFKNPQNEADYQKWLAEQLKKEGKAK